MIPKGSHREQNLTIGDIQSSAFGHFIPERSVWIHMKYQEWRTPLPQLAIEQCHPKFAGYTSLTYCPTEMFWINTHPHLVFVCFFHRSPTSGVSDLYYGQGQHTLQFCLNLWTEGIQDAVWCCQSVGHSISIKLNVYGITIKQIHKHQACPCQCHQLSWSDRSLVAKLRPSKLWEYDSLMTVTQYQSILWTDLCPGTCLYTVPRHWD